MQKNKQLTSERRKSLDTCVSVFFRGCYSCSHARIFPVLISARLEFHRRGERECGEGLNGGLCALGRGRGRVGSWMHRPVHTKKVPPQSIFFTFTSLHITDFLQALVILAPTPVSPSVGHTFRFPLCLCLWDHAWNVTYFLKGMTKSFQIFIATCILQSVFFQSVLFGAWWVSCRPIVPSYRMLTHTNCKTRAHPAH